MSKSYTRQGDLHKICKSACLLPILFYLAGCVPSSPITYLDWGLDQQPVVERNVEGEAQRSPRGLSQSPQQSCVGNSDFEWPVKGSLVRRFSEGTKETSSSGIDILGSEDDPVVAAWDGRVTFAGDLRGYGKVILIAHCETLTGVYANLSTLSVKRGEKVLKGQNIGVLSPSDGYANPMLHFELRDKTLPIDPMRHLKSRNVEEDNFQSGLR